jgi:hypothetical protein
VLHECGAPLCQHCIAQFLSCPKCGQPVTSANSTPLERAPTPRPAARERRLSSINPFRALSARSKGGAAASEAERPRSPTTRIGVHPKAVSHPAPSRLEKEEPETVKAASGKQSKPEPVPETAPSPPTPKPRPKTDDEPRL